MGQLIQTLGNAYASAHQGQGSSSSGNSGQSGGLNLGQLFGGGLNLGQLFGKAQSQQQSPVGLNTAPVGLNTAPVGLNTDPSKVGAKNSLVSNYLMNPTLQNAVSTV